MAPLKKPVDTCDYGVVPAYFDGFVPNQKSPKMNYSDDDLDPKVLEEIDAAARKVLGDLADWPIVEGRDWKP
jgi:hypothetical protein